MTHDQHLIVLRGNSGSGKTTLARRLQHSMGRGTANIGQDHLRRILLREQDLPGAHNIGLIGATARHCLGIGYHVVLEGILRRAHYEEMLLGLLRDHRGPAHVFYLDIPLEETLRRHAGKSLAGRVTPEEVASWYEPHDVLGVPGEVVLDESTDEDATLGLLLGAIGPVVPPPGLVTEHFV